MIYASSIVFGGILAINMYVLSVFTRISDGIDPIIKNMSHTEIIFSIVALFSIYLLSETCVKHFVKRKSHILPAKIILGIVIIAISYILAICIKPSSGKDSLIRSMTGYDFYLLICIEFVFGILTVFTLKLWIDLLLKPLPEKPHRQPCSKQ